MSVEKQTITITQPVCFDLEIKSVMEIKRNDAGKYTIVTSAGHLCVEEIPLPLINAIINRNE